MNFFDPAKNKLLRIICPVLALIIGVSYFAAMKLDFDEDIGHFASGSVPFIVSIVFTVIAAVLSAASYFSAKKYDIVEDEGLSFIYVFGAVFASALSVTVLFTGLSDMRLTAIGSYGTFSVSVLSTQNKFELVSLILSPALAVSYILSLFDKTRKSWVRTLFCILSSLCMIFYLFSSYFDFSLPLNSPVKNYLIVLYSSSLLFLLSEARLSFKAAENRASYAFTCFSSLLSSSAALGISLGMLAHRVFNPLINDPNPSVLQCAMFFAVSLTAFARLCSLHEREKGKKPAEEEAAESVEEEASSEKASSEEASDTESGTSD